MKRDDVLTLKFLHLVSDLLHLKLHLENFLVVWLWTSVINVVLYLNLIVWLCICQKLDWHSILKLLFCDVS